MGYTREEIKEIRRTKLIALRESYGKNQKEFASMIDFNHSYYNRMESGDLSITDKSIQKICIALEIPRSILMEEDTKTSSIDESKKKNIYEDNCYYQLDRLINYGGSTNKAHMQALLQLLIGIEESLESKAQYHDLSENEDKVMDIYMENTFDSFMSLG